MRKTTLYRDGLVFLAITAVLFLGAVIREVNLLLFFASLLVSLVILDLIIARRSLKRLRVHRSIPASIYAGDSFLITISLDNERKRRTAWSILVEDYIVPATDVYGFFQIYGRVPRAFKPVCYFEEVRCGQTLRKSYAGQLPLRGRYDFKQLAISTRFPLGFFRCARKVEESASILVFPKIGKLTRSWFKLYQRQSEEQDRSRNALSRTSNINAGIRNWQAGDARKWIHWPASAKHQKILVRQFEEMQNQEIAIILDLYQQGMHSVENFENSELAVSFCATVIRDFSRTLSGTAYFLAAASLPSSETGVDKDGNIISGKVSLPLIQAMMEALSSVQPAEDDILADRLYELFPKIQGNNTNIVLVTTAPMDKGTSERLKSLRTSVRWNHLLSRILVVDTSSADFSDLFNFD